MDMWPKCIFCRKMCSTNYCLLLFLHMVSLQIVLAFFSLGKSISAIYLCQLIILRNLCPLNVFKMFDDEVEISWQRNTQNSNAFHTNFHAFLRHLLMFMLHIFKLSLLEWITFKFFWMLCELLSGSKTEVSVGSTSNSLSVNSYVRKTPFTAEETGWYTISSCGACVLHNGNRKAQSTTP